MSEPLYKDVKPKEILRLWVLMQMLRGAGWALVVFVAIIAFALAMLAVKAVLPVDPNAALDPVRAVVALV